MFIFTQIKDEAHASVHKPPQPEPLLTCQVTKDNSNRKKQSSGRTRAELAAM